MKTENYFSLGGEELVAVIKHFQKRVGKKTLYGCPCPKLEQDLAELVRDAQYLIDTCHELLDSEK